LIVTLAIFFGTLSLGGVPASSPPPRPDPTLTS
jgi:hypothetical protein